jgi:hypothetical protein
MFNERCNAVDHFAAMEEPQLLAEDLRAWSRMLRDVIG